MGTATVEWVFDLVSYLHVQNVKI